jgi:NAD(P)-dependent dehydrogenase (short-subunit alcohol dehydrogenase family)
MQPPKIDLTGKRALVSGANTGIGATIIQTLAAAGARVAINYVVKPELAESLAEEINAECGEMRAMPVLADVSDETSVARMFEQVASSFGGLDILVNNAGIETSYAAIDLPIAEWDRILNVDLRGAFLCAQNAARLMIKGGSGGVIVNNQSIHDVIARLGATHYCVAKAGLNMLTKMLALEWAEYGIRVVGVSPGAIDSHREDVKEILANMDLSDFNKWIPLGRFGETGDVANVVAFLVSDLASYISGTTIYVDGAYSINLVRYDQRKFKL